MLNKTLLITPGLFIALSIITSSQAIAQNKVFNANPVKFYRDQTLALKVPSFSQNISLNQLDNLRNNSVDSPTNNLVEANVFEIKSTTFEESYQIPELKKPDRKHQNSFCKNFVPELKNDGNCQQEVLTLNTKLQDNGGVDQYQYIDQDYKFTTISRTISNSRGSVLFRDLTEGKHSTVVFITSTTSEPKVANPVNNADALGSQILAQETIEPDVTENDAIVTQNKTVDQYIDQNYRFTAIPITAISHSPASVLFRDLTEGKHSTIVFSTSTTSEPEVTNPITNADSLGSQIIAQEQERVEADITEDESKERAWKFEFTPFAFVPFNVDGDSTVEGVTSDINMDLGEILEILTFAASGRFEAWYKNKFGIIFEGIYLKLGDDGEGIISGPRGLVDLGIEVDVEYDQATFDLAFGYRTEISDGDDQDKVSQAGLPDGYFDIIAGLRVQYLEQRADLNVQLSGPFRTVGIDRDLGQDETWVEPLLSARFAYQISPKFAIGTRGDISGFGIDDLSTTWRIITGFDWVFSGDTSLKLGYEVYSIDYKTSDDEFGLDQFQHGPYIGVTFRF